jgi:hypothetical protein
VEPVMRRGILPAIGNRDIAALTREPVQAALNHIVEMTRLLGARKQHQRIGYGHWALKKARTYIKAVFEYAVDVAGLRPGELFALKTDDIGVRQLRRKH